MNKQVVWAAVPRMSRSAGHAFRPGEELSVCGRVPTTDATEKRAPGVYPSCPRCVEILEQEPTRGK